MDSCFVLPLIRCLFPEELPQGVQIGVGGDGIAETVACAGDNDQFFLSGTCLVVNAAHFAGDIVIPIPMEEYHGHGGVFHRFHGGVGLKIKVTEEFCAQLHEGIAYISGETHLTDHLFNNVLGRAKAAVGEDAQHGWGKARGEEL